VGEFCLAPGSTDYRCRLQYQTYNVTALLQNRNTLEINLADGWCRGSIGAWGVTNVFGRQTKLLCQLEIEYADGTADTILSDDRLHGAMTVRSVLPI
jgi:alpha-L-rhamnosidase